MKYSNLEIIKLYLNLINLEEILIFLQSNFYNSFIFLFLQYYFQINSNLLIENKNILIFIIYCLFDSNFKEKLIILNFFNIIIPLSSKLFCEFLYQNEFLNNIKCFYQSNQKLILNNLLEFLNKLIFNDFNNNIINYIENEFDLDEELIDLINKFK